MKRIALAFLLLLSALSGFAVSTIAISTFTVSGRGVTAAHETLLVDFFTAALAGRKDILLVERRNLEQSLKEIEFSLSDLVDSNTALRTGKFIGAAYILTGSIVGLGDGAFASAQVIDNTTGAVVTAAIKNLRDLSAVSLGNFAAESAAKIVRRLGSPNSGELDLLWLTKSGSVETKPILIYIMSDVADSKDPNGQWYLGPRHLAPVTDALRAHGYGVEIHDRRSLVRLSSAGLSAYSQVWLLEGDGNNVVNPNPNDVMALYNFHLNGGGVWLCGENVLDEKESSWIEDVNAFADAFGVTIDGVVISREPWLPVPADAGHSLLDGVARLVFDNEVGRLVITNRAVKPLLLLDPGSRLLEPGRDVNGLFRLADPERLAEARGGRKDWSFVWLLGKNADQIGPEIGAGAVGIAALDGYDAGTGRVVVDSGWLLGWAFNGDRGELATVGDDLRFVTNAAAWLAGGEE